MAAPLFYNQADQNIYDSGIQYLPQEKFRLGPFTPPKTITDEEKIQTSFGIPATSAFTGSNKFDLAAERATGNRHLKPTHAPGYFS